MRHKYGWLVGLAVLTCGCGGDSSDDSLNVGGEWCGRAVATAAECVGDEVGYLRVSQTGAAVSGRMCEAYEKDCNELQAGEVAGTHFTFFYEFSEFRVDAAFDAQGKNALRGSFHSTKCGCDIPMTLNRVP
jgi:hypothetical protein